MARSSQQKLKILYLMEAFLRRTDQEHPMSVKDLITYLASVGIEAERKTIYDDIEALKTFGMDIVNRRESPAGYYLASREFELPELKLLVDAVQSSRFITSKKSYQLIKKLESLASVHAAKYLQRQVVVANRIKTMNESIYYNIDEIHAAISENCQISFQYYEWTVEKKMHLRREGERYHVSPWGMVWKDENYYMIALDGDIVKHFRVDKMLKIKKELDKRRGEGLFADFDVVELATRTFGMFGGHEETLRLQFENHFVGVVIDRFGKDVMLNKKDEGHFTALVHVTVSPQFFGWVAGLGAGVEIEAPETVRREYIKFLEKTLENYRKKT